MRGGRHLAIAGALLALSLLIGCGSSEPGSTSVVTETVTTETAPSNAVSTTEEEPAPPEEEEEPAEPSGGSGDIVVPDVVGKDHQLAQDTMQAAGLYLLDEEDATGQGRALIVDRNWTVVEQDPPAGTRVSENETILLRSKKDGE